MSTVPAGAFFCWVARRAWLPEVLGYVLVAALPAAAATARITHAAVMEIRVFISSVSFVFDCGVQSLGAENCPPAKASPLARQRLGKAARGQPSARNRPARERRAGRG